MSALSSAAHVVRTGNIAYANIDFNPTVDFVNSHFLEIEESINEMGPGESYLPGKYIAVVDDEYSSRVAYEGALPLLNAEGFSFVMPDGSVLDALSLECSIDFANLYNTGGGAALITSPETNTEIGYCILHCYNTVYEQVYAAQGVMVPNLDGTPVGGYSVDAYFIEIDDIVNSVDSTIRKADGTHPYYSTCRGALNKQIAVDW